MARRQAWLREMGLGSFVPAWVGVPIAFLRPNAGWRERKPFALARMDVSAVVANVSKWRLLPSRYSRKQVGQVIQNDNNHIPTAKH